jgi:hypothetical protein
MFMKIIKDYNQLSIGSLQSTRLYLQARPLLSHWSKKRRGQTTVTNLDMSLIDQELDSNYIAIDCAGWYFANDQRNCTAIELHDQSLRYWNQIYFEYDYLTWHPTYLSSDPVLAYYSSYFKYCELEDFLTFCGVWSKYHAKLIIGLDPTKLKFNYFKHDLLNLLSDRFINQKIRTLYQTNFELLFTMEQK